MRWYAIKIKGAPGSFPEVPGASVAGAQWDSWVNGRNDPNAQEVEFHIEIYNATPDPASETSTLMIHGVSWHQIRDTNKLINLEIEVYGGMKPGLPLATIQSRVAGFLVRGRIQKAWGNWVGTEMSIGLTIAVADDPNRQGATPGAGASAGVAGAGAGAGAAGGVSVQSANFAAPMRNFTKVGVRSIDSRPFSRGPSISQTSTLGETDDRVFDLSGFGIDIPKALANFIAGGSNGLAQPLNIIHNLLPNMPLAAAIRQTLSVALPGVPLRINISPLLKLPYQDAGVYQSLQQYAAMIKKLSQSILGTKNYRGIHISSNGASVDVWDKPLGSGVISVFDLIGQPTWIGINRASVKVVMRSDLKIGDTFTLPSNILMTLGPSSIATGVSEQRSNISIPGTFEIQKILHIGAFRHHDGNNWCTIYEAITDPVPAAGDPPQAQTDKKADAVNLIQNPNQVAQATDGPGAVTTSAPETTPAVVSFGSVFSRRAR